MSWGSHPRSPPRLAPQQVMSVSHRESGGPYQRLMVRVEQLVREALDVPANYAVLFMQGGAHAQFSAVPLNLASPAADGARSSLLSTRHRPAQRGSRRGGVPRVGTGAGGRDPPPGPVAPIAALHASPHPRTVSGSRQIGATSAVLAPSPLAARPASPRRAPLDVAHRHGLLGAEGRDRARKVHPGRVGRFR